MFPSRNRAAFHVRATQSRMYHPWGTSVCFHLVIERLLISGCGDALCIPPTTPIVSISLSSGFSFQEHERGIHVGSGEVSISLSSGFSFQVLFSPTCARLSVSFPSRYRAASHFRLPSADLGVAVWFTSFNLVIERLLISGRGEASRTTTASSTFPSRYRAASHFRIDRGSCQGSLPLFQSRYRAASHFRLICPESLSTAHLLCFHLVIERLLISGFERTLARCR